jgi:hypothetical protein
VIPTPKPKRRSETDVAADALAAIYCSGLVKRSSDVVRTMAKHVGVDVATAVAALDRHVHGKCRCPRDVPVDPRPPEVVPISGATRDARRRRPVPAPLAADNGRKEKGARYSEETKARVAARAHEIGIGPAAREAGVSWPTVRQWAERRPPTADAPGYQSWPHPKRVTA